jgi:hypothetical protein
MATAPTIYQHDANRHPREHFGKMYDLLRSDRSSFDSHWQEIANFIQPRRARFTASDRNKGDKRNQNIINSQAKFAARTLQAGLHSGLTSPARPWFKLTVADRDLAKRDNVKKWLHDVTWRMSEIFNRSNVYQSLPTIYGDLGLFGTGAMSLVGDANDIIRTQAFPVGSYVVGVDSRNMVAQFAREFEYTVLQLVEAYGGPEGASIEPGDTVTWANFSAHIKELWDAGSYEQPVRVRWVVARNPDYDPRKPQARYKRWASVHFEVGHDGAEIEHKTLRYSGYDRFPVLVPRWEVTGEDAYGTDCPGMTVLGDVKQLQGMERMKGKLLHKAVDPPLRGPSMLKTQKTSLVPGDITYVDVREGMSGLAPIHEVRLEGYQHLVLDVDSVMQRIDRAFYADLFLMLAYSDGRRGLQPITAEEVKERHEEKLLQLGPVLERANKELLDPAIDLTYIFMSQRGLVPEPPEELVGVNLGVEYVSIMAQAQKLVGVVGHDRFLQTILPMAEMLPGVINKLDVNVIVNEYADALGINPSIVVPDEVADQRAQAQAQAAAAAQQAEVMATTAKAAQSAAAAPVGEGTMLDAVLGGPVAPNRGGLR